VLRVITRRLLQAVPLVLLVSMVTFVLTALVPGDPAYLILGGNATPEQVAQFDHRMGFDLPVWEQYWNWLHGAVTGHFGTSFLSGEEVWPLVTSHLPVTLSLVIGGTLLGTVGGIALGVVSGIRSGATGRLTELLQMVGLAFPNFWVGLVLIEVFAVKLSLFPPTGYVPLTESPGEWLRSLVLPVFALALPAFAGIAKATRDGIRDAMGRDYVKMLRASGVREWRIVYVHALRNAAIPVLTFVGPVFAMPGIGSLAQSSALGHDLAVIQAIAVVYCLVVVAANLLTDLAYGWANPKARTS
jgi:peptide/nickel transport system permease protein